MSIVEKKDGYAVLKCDGKYSGEFMIDLEDADRVAQHQWNISKLGFVRAWIGGGAVMLQRFLLDGKKGCYCKKISNDKYDYRKSNLKLITKAVN